MSSDLRDVIAEGIIPEGKRKEERKDKARDGPSPYYTAPYAPASEFQHFRIMVSEHNENRCCCRFATRDHS